MELRRLNPNFAVGPQIEPNAVETLAALGFRSILVNRPDGEEPGQPDFDTIADAARKQGMEVRHQPIAPGQIGEEQVESFAQALHDLPGPTYAYCRTGTRSITLWVLANPDCLSAEDRIQLAADNGYDLAGLRQRLGGDLSASGQ